MFLLVGSSKITKEEDEASLGEREKQKPCFQCWSFPSWRLLPGEGQVHVKKGPWKYFGEKRMDREFRLSTCPKRLLATLSPNSNESFGKVPGISDCLSSQGQHICFPCWHKMGFVSTPMWLVWYMHHFKVPKLCLSFLIIKFLTLSVVLAHSTSGFSTPGTDRLIAIDFSLHKALRVVSVSFCDRWIFPVC